MPHNWVILTNTAPPWNEVSGDPAKYRAAVAETVAAYGGRLVEMYWAVDEPRSFALVDGPGDPIHTKAMLRALPSVSLTTVLDPGEAQRAYSLQKKAKK